MAKSGTVQTIIDKELPLAAIDAVDTGRALELFHRSSLETGSATYLWEEGFGLFRTGMHHLPLPNTKDLRGALSFIRSTIHFGVYVFPNATAQLHEERNVEAIRKLSENSHCRRLMVFIDEKIKMPQELKSMSVKVRHGYPKAKTTPGTPRGNTISRDTVNRQSA